MGFIYNRTIHFQDTDAAGVVYFANIFGICHEAYEDSLAQSEIDLKVFFQNQVFAIPIVHASIDFFSPLFCGDRIRINLSPKQLTENKFEIEYQIYHTTGDKLLAQATTRHICIDPSSRSKKELPLEIKQWLIRNES